MRNPQSTLTAFCVCLAFIGISCGPKVTPPSVPVMNGPSSGVVGSVLTFKVMSVDTNEDTVAYMVHWGDTTPDRWTAFAQSGDSVSVSHVYLDSSVYSAKAKAVNGAGVESEWSEPCSIHISRLPSQFPDSLVRILSIGSNAQGLVISPDGDYLYMSLYSDSRILVVRTSDYAITETIQVGSWPTAMALSHDGSRLYVALTGADSVGIVNIPGRSVQTVPCPGVYGVALTPDCQYFYAISSTGHLLLKWRVSDDSFIDSLNIGKAPDAVSADPNSEYIYTTAESSLIAVGISSNEVLARLDLGANTEAVCPSVDGAYVCVGSYEKGVHIVSRDGSHVDTTFGIDGHPGEIAFTPDGRFLLVGNWDYRGIPVFAASDFALAGRLTPVGPGAGLVAVDPSGNRVYAAAPDGKVYVFGHASERQ